MLPGQPGQSRCQADSRKARSTELPSRLCAPQVVLSGACHRFHSPVFEVVSQRVYSSRSSQKHIGH